MSIDNAILKMKLNKALETLRKEPRENLEKRLSKMNVDEIRKTLSEIDIEKIRSMVPEAEKLKSKVTDEDLAKLRQVAGKDYKDIYEQAEKLFKEI